MTLSTVDFDSRSDALTAAEYEGYDASSVSISVDPDSGRFQWNLRSFDVALDAEGEAPSGADAAADVVADMVAGLPDALSGFHYVESFDDVTLTDISVPAGWSSVDGGLTHDDATRAGEPTPIRMADVTIENVVVAGDLVMQVFGAMPAAALGMFAQAFADKHMAIVTLRDAVTFEVRSVVTPGMGKVKRAGGSGAASGGSVTRAPVEREETMNDRIKRGVWPDSDLESSPQNSGILGLKRKIEDAYNAGDMDALLAYDFKGAKFEEGSTYYRRAGWYLRFLIGKLTATLAEREATRVAEQAALDAEFGFTEEAGFSVAA